MTATLKVCRGCKQRLPLAAYRRNGDRRRARCRQCEAEARLVAKATAALGTLHSDSGDDAPAAEAVGGDTAGDLGRIVPALEAAARRLMGDSADILGGYFMLATALLPRLAARTATSAETNAIAHSVKQATDFLIRERQRVGDRDAENTAQALVEEWRDFRSSPVVIGPPAHSDSAALARIVELAAAHRIDADQAAAAIRDRAADDAPTGPPQHHKAGH